MAQDPKNKAFIFVYFTDEEAQHNAMKLLHNRSAIYGVLRVFSLVLIVCGVVLQAASLQYLAFQRGSYHQILCSSRPSALSSLLGFVLR